MASEEFEKQFKLANSEAAMWSHRMGEACRHMLNAKTADEFWHEFNSYEACKKAYDQAQEFVTKLTMVKLLGSIK
jgi:hypothetical protein